jgi:hypothetical protein
MARLVRIALVFSLALAGGLYQGRELRAADHDYAGIPARITPFDSRYVRVQQYLEAREAQYTSLSEKTSSSPSSRSVKTLKKHLKAASRFDDVQDQKAWDDGYGRSSYASKRKEHPGDYWQLPEETESRGAGDCEDKAIWLYTRLIAMGFEDVRLVVGKYRPNQADLHAWVMYRSKGKVYILDPAIYQGLWEARHYPKGYYRPFYSYSKDKRWRHKDVHRDLVKRRPKKKTW